MAPVTTLFVFQVCAVYLLRARVGGKSHYRFFARASGFQPATRPVRSPDKTALIYLSPTIAYSAAPLPKTRPGDRVSPRTSIASYTWCPASVMRLSKYRQEFGASAHARPPGKWHVRASGLPLLASCPAEKATPPVPTTVPPASRR